MGFKVGYVDVEHQERFQGQSSYTLRELVRHALHGSVSQSKRLLHFSLGLGAAYVAAAFLTVIYIVIRWALWGMKEGWPSTAVLIMASTGCIMLTLGILGSTSGLSWKRCAPVPSTSSTKQPTLRLMFPPRRR